jgi:integrase/recombinase XerD
MVKLTQAVALYDADKRLEGYSPHTLAAYAIQARLLVRAVGDVAITQLSTAVLKTYLSRDAERLKASSLGFRIRYLKSLFRWAHENALVTVNPASSIREPKQGVRIPKALTEDVVEELRESCAITLEHALIETFYTTGCRIGELVGLNRSDIDFDARQFVVRGKGDKEREVYFSSKCGIWLKRYLRSRRDTDVALFVTERAPRRMKIAQMRYVVKRIAKRADTDVNIYPHKLRHSYATHLLNNGAPIDAIQTLLGHSKADTTRLYAQLSGTRRRELYRKYF